MKQFYRNCCDYLAKWSIHFEPMKLLKWIDLKNKCSWPEVQESLGFILSTFKNITVDEGELFDEISCLKKICDCGKNLAMESGKN